MKTFSIIDLRKLLPEGRSRSLVIILRSNGLGKVVLTLVQSNTRYGPTNAYVQLSKFDTQECLDYFKKRSIEPALREQYTAGYKQMVTEMELILAEPEYSGPLPRKLR